MGAIAKIEAAARAWRMSDKIDASREPLSDQKIADLNRMAAVALSKMLKGRHVDICTINDVIKLIPGASESCPEHRILRTLHCVDLADVPRELRESIPALIRAVLTCAAVV